VRAYMFASFAFASVLTGESTLSLIESSTSVHLSSTIARGGRPWPSRSFRPCFPGKDTPSRFYHRRPIPRKGPALFHDAPGAACVAELRAGFPIINLERINWTDRIVATDVATGRGKSLTEEPRQNKICQSLRPCCVRLRLDRESLSIPLNAISSAAPFGQGSLMDWGAGNKTYR
jgi:hypothetical protein